MPQYVLLDRDGVINRRIANGYVTRWQEFEFLPGVMEALRLLAEYDCKVIVVSNQACVGKGLVAPEQVAGLTRRFRDEVEASGGAIEAVYSCMHREEDGCECRKPRAGLLWRAQHELRFDLAETFLIGDSETDFLAARAAGCRFIWLANGNTGCRPTQKVRREGEYFEAMSLLEAVRLVLLGGADGFSESRGKQFQHA
jgi:D-glycero-D-manno-heptose 1,7-bisphosphate phosphatase